MSSTEDESSDGTAREGHLEDIGDGTAGEDQTPTKKQKKEKEQRNRGNRMTAAKRCLDFPQGYFFVQGNEMWCCACHSLVDYRQITTGKKHVMSAKHRKNVEKLSSRVITPGPGALLEKSPNAPTAAATSSQQGTL